MKKLLTLGMAVILAGQFTSCSKKSTNPSSSSPIVGKWRMVDIYADQPVPFGDTVIRDFGYVFKALCGQTYMVFNADGTGQIIGTSCNPADTSIQACKWKLDNSNLTFTVKDSSYTSTLIKVNSDSLLFHGSGYQSSDSIGVVTTFNATATCQRL